MYNYDYIKINEIFVYFLYQESFSKLCIDFRKSVQKQPSLYKNFLNKKVKTP